MTENMEKKYNVIYADPAWDYGKMKERKKAHRGGNPQSHYGTMSIDEICALPISNLTDENACLFLWVTNPKMQLGFEVMKAWGFKYQTTITWVKIDSTGKPINNGMGFYFRGATEHILFGTKGKYKIETYNRLPNVLMAKRDKHSKKPIEAYELIEKVTMGERLELFARNNRIGWDAWGNEVAESIEFVNDHTKHPTKEGEGSVGKKNINTNDLPWIEGSQQVLHKAHVIGSAPDEQGYEDDTMEYQGCINCGSLTCADECFEPEY